MDNLLILSLLVNLVMIALIYLEDRKYHKKMKHIENIIINEYQNIIEAKKEIKKNVFN